MYETAPFPPGEKHRTLRYEMLRPGEELTTAGNEGKPTTPDSEIPLMKPTIEQMLDIIDAELAEGRDQIQKFSKITTPAAKNEYAAKILSDEVKDNLVELSSDESGNRLVLDARGPNGEALYIRPDGSIWAATHDSDHMLRDPGGHYIGISANDKRFVNLMDLDERIGASIDNVRFKNLRELDDRIDASVARAEVRHGQQMGQILTEASEDNTVSTLQEGSHYLVPPSVRGPSGGRLFLGGDGSMYEITDEKKGTFVMIRDSSGEWQGPGRIDNIRQTRMFHQRHQEEKTGAPGENTDWDMSPRRANEMMANKHGRDVARAQEDFNNWRSKYYDQMLALQRELEDQTGVPGAQFDWDLDQDRANQMAARSHENKAKGRFGAIRRRLGR